MRLIYATMAVLLAATAFAQTSVTPRRTPVAAAPNLLPAQTAVENPAYIEDTTVIDPKVRGIVPRRSSNPYAELPNDIADKLTDADLQKQAEQQKYYKKVAEPILSPDGKELVAMVGNRYLTKEELQKRASLMLKALPRSEQTGLIIMSSDKNTDQKQAEEDRRILVEGRVLDDWAHVATLAVHAENASREVPALRVSDAEIADAIRKLSADARIDVTKIPVAMQTVMLSERELHQEVRDSLLVEKYMNEYVKRNISNKELKDLFEKDPSAFVEPTKVHAYEMFIPKDYQNGGQTRKTEKVIGSWRGTFSRCKNVDDLKALGEKVKKDQAAMILSDMGWVLSTDALDPEIRKAIFELEKGKTSKVISSAQGYQVFKVIERTEGDKPDFEKARPRVISYLTNKLRDVVYENIKGQYGVRMAASGLKKWTVVGTAAETAASANAAQTSAPATVARAPITVNTEPGLGLLRRPTSTGRRYRAPLRSVESVVGVKAQTRAGGIKPAAAPGTLAAPAH